MMDHKTIRQRGARADFQLMIAGIMEDEEKRKELIKKYSNPDGKHLENKNVQRILIGNWLHNGAIMLLRGATREELDRVAEHVVVLLMALKYNLDIYQSHRDQNLLELAEKYLVDPKKAKQIENEKILAKRKELIEKRAKEHEKKVEHRKEMQQKIQEYLDSGCTMEYTAKELGIPESTVRSIMKYHD